MDSDAKCNPVDSIGSSTKKSGFPVRTPAFCSVSRGPSRLGEKECRAPSMTPGVALRPRTQGAVVTTRIALSATYSNAEASPLPMVLVGLLVTVFLLFEARRYRYFNVWRARARLLETDFYAPMLSDEGARRGLDWAALLARDYRNPSYNISYARAIGRRLRRTYGWIFAIQAIAYYGKLAIHPTPLTAASQIWERAAIGPLHGAWVITAGICFHAGWALFAIVTQRIEVASRRDRRTLIAMG